MKVARRSQQCHRRGVLLVIAAAAIVFAGLAIAGALAAAHAMAGFAIVAAAVAGRHARRQGERTPGAAARGAQTRAADPLEAVVAGLPDPVIALDRDGRVLALQRARARAGAGAAAGRAGLARAAHARTDRGDRPRRLRSGEAQRVEFSERVPLDRWFEAFVCRSAWPDASRPDLVLMTLHDLTPLRRVEEMRADFVANASHELRTPLAALSGFIETLQGPARDDATARERFLAIMQEQARRMARLIDDLLSLSRIELNAHRRPDTPVDLVPIVRQVVDGLQTLARDRGVTVNVDGADRPLMVLGDRDELIRVFENLVENALKYGAAGKRVDIALALATAPEGEPEARVAVRDYGPGIAPEHLPRLTERFYRVDVRESRAQGGTGLGLALVKHILNRHRGRLSIESTPGSGRHLHRSPAHRGPRAYPINFMILQWIALSSNCHPALIKR